MKPPNLMKPMIMVEEMTLAMMMVATLAAAVEGMTDRHEAGSPASYIVW
jgi:hypothetical protein